EVAARANGSVLVAYMLGLVPFASLYLIKRYFFAYEDARTPFLVQIPIAAITLLSVPVILNLVDPQWAAMAAAGSASFGNRVAWAMGRGRRGGRRPGLGAEPRGRRPATLSRGSLGGAAVGGGRGGTWRGRLPMISSGSIGGWRCCWG